MKIRFRLAAAVLALALAAAALLLAVRRRDLLRGLAPMACLWALAVLAPASCLVLGKAHSDVHSHLIPVLFQYSAVPASLALAGALAAAVLRAARGVRRASAAGAGLRVGRICITIDTAPRRLPVSARGLR